MASSAERQRKARARRRDGRQHFRGDLPFRAVDLLIDLGQLPEEGSSDPVAVGEGLVRLAEAIADEHQLARAKKAETPSHRDALFAAKRGILPS